MLVTMVTDRLGELTVVKCATFNRDINKAGATKEKPAITTEQLARLQTEKSLSAELNVLWAPEATLDGRTLLSYGRCTILHWCSV
jgi:hypothetical protein